MIAAQQHGVELDFDTLMNSAAIKKGQEPDAHQLSELASTFQLKSAVIAAGWNDLKALRNAAPVIAQLKNNHFIVVSGVYTDGAEEYVSILELSSEQAKPMRLNKEKFCKAWASRIILIGAIHKQDERLTNDKLDILKLFLRERSIMLQTLSLSALITLLTVSVIAGVCLFFQQVVLEHELSSLLQWGTAAALLLSLGYFLRYLMNYIAAFATAKLSAALQIKLFQGLYQHASEPLNVSDSFDRIHRACAEVSKLIGEVSLSLCYLLATVSLALILAPTLAISLAIFFTLILLIRFVTAANLINQSQVEASYIDAKQLTASTVMAKLNTILFHNLASKYNAEWERHTAGHSIENLKHQRYQASVDKLCAFLVACSLLTAIAIASQSFVSGGTTVSTLLMIPLLAWWASFNWNRALTGAIQIQSVRERTYQLAPYYSEHKHITDNALKPSLEGAIELRNLSWHYAGDTALFQNLRLSVSSQQTIQISGPCGAGKKTLMRLIQGELHAQSGSVFIDGYDTRTIDSAHLYQSIVRVDDQPTLFKGTIRKNILMAAPFASQAQFNHAIELAKLPEDLKALSKGLDTIVNDDATNLPRALLPKIALARALLQQPKVLMIYDPQSYFARVYQQDLASDLHKLADDRTLIWFNQEAIQTQAFDRHITMTKQHRLEETEAQTANVNETPQLRDVSTETDHLSHETPRAEHPEVKTEQKVDTSKLSESIVMHASHEHDQDHKTHQAVNADHSISEYLSSDKRSSTEKHSGIEKHKHQSMNSLKLKELSERLHRHNLQAQEARQQAEKKLDALPKGVPDARSLQRSLEPQITPIKPEPSQTEAPLEAEVLSPDTNANNPAASAQTISKQESKPESRSESKSSKLEAHEGLSKQEQTLSSFIDGYLHDDK